MTIQNLVETLLGLKERKEVSFLASCFAFLGGEFYLHSSENTTTHKFTPLCIAPLLPLGCCLLLYSKTVNEKLCGVRNIVCLFLDALALSVNIC